MLRRTPTEDMTTLFFYTGTFVQGRAMSIFFFTLIRCSWKLLVKDYCLTTLRGVSKELLRRATSGERLIKE